MVFLECFLGCGSFTLGWKALQRIKNNLIPIPAMSMGQRIHQLFEMWLWCVPSQLVSICLGRNQHQRKVPIHTYRRLPHDTRRLSFRAIPNPKTLRSPGSVQKIQGAPITQPVIDPKSPSRENLRHLWVNFHVHPKECKQLNRKTHKIHLSGIIHSTPLGQVTSFLMEITFRTDSSKPVLRTKMTKSPKVWPTRHCPPWDFPTITFVPLVFPQGFPVPHYNLPFVLAPGIPPAQRGRRWSQTLRCDDSHPQV